MALRQEWHIYNFKSFSTQKFTTQIEMFGAVQHVVEWLVSRRVYISS